MVKEAEENGMKTPIDADSLRSPMNKEYSGGMFG